MTLLHGITVLDLIDELPPGSRGFVPADVAGFFEVLAIVEHRTLTSGEHYIHHGVIQSATEAGLSLPRGFPVEIPGLNTGIRFQFSSTRAAAAAGQNLEPEPSGWQLDLFLDRLAIPIPGLKPAVRMESGPSSPAYLAPLPGGGDRVKFYGKGVLRIFSAGDGVEVRLIADPDPFTPDAPIGAVLELGLAPPHALFGDGSSGFGMTLGTVTVDASTEFTPTEIIARGHGPEWQGFGVSEAAIYLPRNLPGVGDVSLGVKDLLIGTSDPGGVQLEAWLEFGQSDDSVGNLQFFQDVGGQIHDLPAATGASNQRTITVHAQTEEVARVRARVNASPARNAQWKRPDDTTWQTGSDTGWFRVRVGQQTLKFRDVNEREIDGQTRDVTGQEIIFSFRRPDDALPAQPPTIRVTIAGLSWDNVAHLGGSADSLGAPTFTAIAPTLTADQRAALTWSLEHAGATVSGRGESFTPTVSWQTGEHALILSDQQNRRRRINIQVLEDGLLIVGSGAGVEEVVAGVKVPAVPTSVVATHNLSSFHTEGRLDSGGSPAATISGTAVTVAAGTLADVALERGGEEDPDEQTPPASPPVAHTRILMEYDRTTPWAWHELHAQDIDASTRDPWGPAPIYPAHDNSTLAHSGDARQRMSASGVQAAVTAWVTQTRAIDPSIRFIVVGHTCDLGSASHNQALGRERATAGETILLAAGVPAAQLDAWAEQDGGSVGTDPTGFTLPNRRLSDRTATGWRIKQLHAAELSSWGQTRNIPEREASRGVDIYALIPAANADDGDPSVDDSQGSSRRRALVPGADPTTTPAVAPAETNLNYRFEIRAKWDSPSWVDERDSIPVLIQLTFDWTPTDLPLPSTGGGDNGAITPVDPNTNSSPDNYRIVARFTFDPRSGQAVFSASLDSPGDENGLLKFTSSGNDADDIAGKMFATALALGPALLADVSTASEETNAVRISALLAAIVAATALDIVQEGTVVLHRVEIEHLQRDLGVVAGSRTRILCDYVVELKCSAEMFGIVSEDPIKLRYKNVGLELDDSKDGIEKFNVIFEEADFEVVNPGKWKINGWLGQLLGITAIRLGTGSLWFELDMELALDLGVVEISRATIRITIKDGGVTVDLRGLAASVDIPGTVKGAGALQVGGDGDVSASLDLTIIPADIRAYAAFVMRDGMTHLEAGLRFATAIPLGGTGFGLFGFMGRFVSNGTRNFEGLPEDPVQREMDWYARPVVGSQPKYTKLDGQYAIGLGVVVGTMPDAGFTFNAEGMLTFEFPDPSVVLTIDASLMNPPSGEASETGGGGASYSLSLLGVIAISAQGLAIGIAGKFEIPDVVVAKIPFAAWFPFQSGGPAGYLRVGSDGHRGRAGEPVTVAILPKIFDLKAWSFFMVEENELLELGKHPDFNFYGFSIGFGAGFSLKWGGDAVYLEVSASILAGFGTRPFTLMAGIFLKGELWLLIIGLGVSAELILRLAEDSWDLRGKVCAKISFFFFTIEGCVEFKIGDEPHPPLPPLEPLVTGVQLADKRARVLADAVDEAQGTTLDAKNTAWPDATIVIHFSHTVQLALESDSVQPTATTVGAGWVGTERVKYLYVLESVELLDVHGNPVGLTDASGANPIFAPDWPSVWWMPAFRAALPEDGQPPAGDHEGWDLGVLKWDPAPWARAVPRGGDGLVSDPAEVLPRACDDPPAPSIHCVFGSNHQRTAVDRVTLRGPITGELPYRSYFRVDAREGYGPLGIEMLSEYARLYGLALVPGAGVMLPELVDPVHGHGIDGGWQLPYLVKQGKVQASLGFYADYVGDVVAPDLVLAVCIDIPSAESELERCVGFKDFAPNQQLGAEIAVDQVVFRDRGAVLRTVDQLPINNPDGTSELLFTSKGLEITLPSEATWVSVQATWFHELGDKLELVAFNGQGVELGRTSGGTRTQLSTLEISAARIVRLILVGGNSTGVVTRVCYRTKQTLDGEAWAKQLFATMLGKQSAAEMLHAVVPNQPILPLVRGVRLDGEREAWVPEPVDFAVGNRRACLFLRYQPQEGPEQDGPWAGFEILPFPRTKLIVVSTCAMSLDAWEAAAADDELREDLQDAINDAAHGDQDDRVVLLDANTTYRVRITYKAAIWERSDDSPTPPSPSTLDWSALPASVTAHLDQVQTFRFRTAADAALPDEALLAFERQDRFDPRALLRYLRGFDPDVASAHHLLDDLLWVHFDVEWIETLLARYGYALELSVRRTDPPPQPEGAPPFPLLVPLIKQWYALPPVMLELADQRVFEALGEAPCVEPVPEGGSAGLQAELDPRAEYDIIVSAVHSDPSKTRYIKRGHFKTSRYRDVSGLLAAMGFPVTVRRDVDSGIETATGAEASPIFPFDFLADAAPPTGVELGSDAALDAALAAIGMDPWPLPSGPAAVLIWLQQGASWRLAAVLLDSDESMMRPPLPAELIPTRLDGEDVSTPPPPPPLPPPRMEIEALQIPGVAAAVFTPRRSNASGTRVLLVANSPVDLGSASDTAIAQLLVRDRVIDLGGATPTYRTIRLRAERFVTRVPHIVYQEQA